MNLFLSFTWYFLLTLSQWCSTLDDLLVLAQFESLHFKCKYQWCKELYMKDIIA